MRSYRTKDLSITVLPEGRLDDCLFRTNICLHPTGGVCPRDATVCPGGTRICQGTDLCARFTVCPGVTNVCVRTGGCGVNFSYPVGTPLERLVTVREPRELEQLKQELAETLEQLEEVDEDDLGRGAREPSTYEEAEELEERLKQALKDVQARKKKLG